MKPMMGMVVLAVFIILASFISINSKHISRVFLNIQTPRAPNKFDYDELSPHASLTTKNETSKNDPEALRPKSITSEGDEEEKEVKEEEEEYDDHDEDDHDGDDGEDVEDVEEEEEQLDPRLVPTVIIAGAQKGGTNALRSFLNGHPQMKRSIQGEPHFFDKICSPYMLVSPDTIKRTRVQYASLWEKDADGEQQKYTFEKTPKYLFDPYVPEKVKTIVPWTKIIMLLRDPVERAYSQFKMLYALFQVDTHEHKYGKVTFETCIDIDIQKLTGAGITNDDTFWEVDDQERERRWLKYWSLLMTDTLTIQGVCASEVGRGLYSMQLRRWFKEYNSTRDRKKIFITTSESLLPDEKTHVIDLKPITDFIGIDEIEIIAGKKIHATSSHFDPMKDETRQKLNKIFDPFNKDLERLLGDKWKDPWPYSR